MVLVIDAQIAGISGDMLLCSLVHLGADSSKIIHGVKHAVTFLPNSSINDIEFVKVNKGGIQATSLKLDITNDTDSRSGKDMITCITQAIESLQLSDSAKQFTKSCIIHLINAESKIHGVLPDSVHLHEASSIDTIVDIVGCAIALDDLGIFGDVVISTPVAVGGKSVTFSHGVMSNPASAILEIFSQTSTNIVGGPVDVELTTPTGAALLVNLATLHQKFYPTMNVDTVGYGAGSRDLDGVSNVLKLVRGNITDNHDSINILETNLDDVSGELLGHLIDTLMSNGAVDVTIVAGITKKSRPTHLVTVLCMPSNTEKLLELLLSETRTLGVRVRSSERFVHLRDVQSVDIMIHGETFTIQCKVFDGHMKPEFDDVAKIAKKLNMPLIDINEMILTQLGNK